MLSAILFPVILWKVKQNFMFVFGFMWKLARSISKNFKQSDKISLPWDVTLSANIKWGHFHKQLRQNVRTWSAAISRISFWMVLLVYFAFLGPSIKCSLRVSLFLASSLSIAKKFPSFLVRSILSWLCPCSEICCFAYDKMLQQLLAILQN